MPNFKNLKEKIKTYKSKPFSFFLFLLVSISFLLTMASISFIIIYIAINGLKDFSFDIFSFKYTSENVSLTPALFNTFIITILSLLLAVPLGIGSAIYLVEYARPNNKLVGLIRLTVETLSGIPSIIFGLFGALFFVKFMGLGMSLLAGAFTLVLMVLPSIIRVTEEALMQVPSSYREASYGLGAGKLRTIFKVILPVGLNQILSGIILAIGRIVGESAALIFTAGTVANIGINPFKSGRTLAVHMYAISGEGLYVKQTYQTALILLFVVFIINKLSSLIINRIGEKNNG